jgi:NDP-sugar pyrophosphorylase family protein
MNQWDILRQTNQIGENCDIHPTAYVEGSIIGNDVRIGAGAVIRQSAVGDGAYLCNSVTMELAVAGEKSYLGNGTVLQVSLVYPGTVAANRAIASSLCGRDTFLGEGVVLTDFRFDAKTVTVLKDGIPVDTGNPMVGVCLGHGVYLGGGSIVAPGRSIPNGLRLVPGQSRVIEDVGPGGEVDGYRRIEA